MFINNFIDEDPLDEMEGEPLLDLEDLGQMVRKTKPTKKVAKKVNTDQQVIVASILKITEKYHFRMTKMKMHRNQKKNLKKRKKTMNKQQVQPEKC